MLDTAHKTFKEEMKKLSDEGKKVSDQEISRIASTSYQSAMQETLDNNPAVKASWDTETAAIGSARTIGRRYKSKKGVWKTTGGTEARSVKSPESRMPSYATIRANNLAEFNDGAAESHIMLPSFLRRFLSSKTASVSGASGVLDKKEIDMLEGAEKNFGKAIDIESQSASPSKVTKKAAKNIVDGVVVGLEDGAPKIKAVSKNISQTSLPGFENYGTVGPSSSPYGPSMEGGNFVSGKGGKLSRVRSRMTNAAGGMNIQSKMAGSAALMMAGQAAGSMLQSGSNAAAIAGSASSMAGMGMMFGAWGGAAGAALGLVTGGIGALMKAEKEHAAVVSATFSTSANEIALFGMASMDATIRTKNLLSSIPGIASSLSELTPKVQSYVNAINALPKNDPTAMFVEGLKKLNGNLKATAGQLRTKASEAISLGGMDPEKAKEYVMTMLAAAGRTKDFAEVWKSVQGSLSNSTAATTTILEKETQAIKKNGDSWVDVTRRAKDYNALTDAQKRLADTTLKLFGTMTNSSLSYKDMSDRLAGIKKSSIDGADGVNALTAAVKNSGNADAIASLQSITDGLRSMGGEAAVTLSNMISIQGLQNTGISLAEIQKSQNKDFAPPSKATNIYQQMLDYSKTPKGKAAIKKAHEDYILQQKAIAAITGDVSGTGTTATTFKGSAQQQADVTALTTRISAQNAYKKTVEDELKAQQKITTELQRQQQFQQTKMDLQNQMRMARASGNFMGAAMLQQQLYSTQSEFTNQTAQNALQAKVDSMTTVVDTLTSALADLRDAISNNKNTISKGVNPALTTSIINSEGKKTKETIPAPTKKWRGGLLQGAGSSFSDSINLMASNGEYIVNAPAVKQIGTPILNAINSGATAGIMGNTTYNVTVNAGSNASADDIAKTVMSTIQRQNAMTSTNRRVGG